MAVSRCKCRLICALSLTLGLILSFELVQNVSGTEELSNPETWQDDDDLLDFPLINAAEPRAKRTLFSGGENADVDPEPGAGEGLEFDSFVKFITSKK